MKICIDKIDELKKLGFYEIDLDYIQRYMQKGSMERAKKQGVKFILARKINNIIIFYSEEYIKSKSIDELDNKLNWLD